TPRRLPSGAASQLDPSHRSSRVSSGDDKGPSASLAPSAAGSTYSKYASPAAFGRRLAAGPFSSLCPARFDLVERREGPICGGTAPSTAGSTYSKYASPAAFGRRLAAGPFSSLC